MQNLPVPHTKLHPNDETVELAIFAHEAESRFVRKQMLAQIVLATHAASIYRAQHLLRRAYPNDGNAEAECFACVLIVNLLVSACSPVLCQPDTRSHTRLAGVRKLLLPHTALGVGQPEGKCSHSFCPPHELSLRAILL